MARVALAVAVIAAASLAWLQPWNRPPVPPAEIKSVQVLSATTAVVLTSAHVAYETRDGGAGWRSFAVLADAEIRFVDATHGFQATEDRLLATADGGRSWQARALPPGQHYAPAAWFLDAGRGWYLNLNFLPGTGLPRTLYRTFDGGRSWQWVWSGTSGTAQVPVFADPDHGWMAADLSVLATADGGRTWARVPAPLLGARAGVRLAGDGLVEYSSQLSAAGEVIWQAATSTDGGATWSAPVQAPRGGLIDLAFADVQHWRGISRSAVWRTDDGGLDWQPVVPRLPSGAWIDSTTYLDANRAWALAGSQPSSFPTRLLRTADGGGSWTEVSIPSLG